MPCPVTSRIFCRLVEETAAISIVCVAAICFASLFAVLFVVAPAINCAAVFVVVSAIPLVAVAYAAAIVAVADTLLGFEEVRTCRILLFFFLSEIRATR